MERYAVVVSHLEFFLKYKVGLQGRKTKFMEK